MEKIDDYYKQFDGCRQKEKPACTSICPFHLNVLDFQDKVKRHKYDRAYRDYKNAVCFPDIVAELCPEYCNKACPRKDFDGAVQLNLLEKACVANAKRKEPTAYNLPRKEGKIGIVGAGISGLACALKLLEKKYEIIIFEKENQIGGQLKELLPPEVFLDEINRQFSKEKYELFTNTEIFSLKELDEYNFDAIYIATGKNGNDFGIMGSNVSDNHCNSIGDVAIFAGGSLVGKDVVQSIAHGIDIAWAIEVFLRTGNQEYPQSSQLNCQVVPDKNKFVPCKPVIPSSENGLLSDKEVEFEASRCIRCQCDACRSQCDLVAFSNKWPVAIKEDIAMTVVSTESMIHKTPAIRIINTCTQCGLFEEACPEEIEMNDLILESKKLLHKQGKMPPAFHGFWLDDMEHANGEFSRVCTNAPGKNKSEYAFFPGCNLGASNHSYVFESYKWLQNNFDNMGLLLRCCGIPADWAGNEEMHLGQIESLKDDWTKLGKPVLITACPSCTKHINDYLPEINTTSIYELMSQSNLWPESLISDKTKSTEYSMFDPCSARNDNGIMLAVREATKELKVNDLPNGTRHGCCGFGGNVEVANPDFVKYVAKKRISLSENPYITYCINCKDIFIREKKAALHVFDLLFDIEDSKESLPNLSQRRNNRIELKNNLMEKIFGEKIIEETKKYEFEIEIPNELRNKMDELKLVDEDIKQVIDRSNYNNRRTYDKKNDVYICYSKLNYITCWVIYRLTNNKYHIINVYTHRMDIELEDIWNGRKIQPDM